MTVVILSASVENIGVSNNDAGWSSPVARWAHNPKVKGSNPFPATKKYPVTARGYTDDDVCAIS